MAEEVQQGKKPVVPIVIAAIVVVAIAAVAFVMLTAKKQVKIPDLVYKSQADAEKAIKDAGLTLGKVEESTTNEYFDGYVIRQDPASGETIDEGSEVSITIARGLIVPETIVVPDLKGKTAEEAEKALQDAWIIPLQGDPVHSDDVEAGKVCTQSIAAGTKIDFGVAKVEAEDFVEVTYATSLGKEQVVVPDVTGKPEGEARDKLTAAGLVIDTTSSYNDSVPQGNVISQSVAKDTQVVKGTLVRIEISLGKKPVQRVIVPQILTYSLQDAKNALESAGLRYDYSGDTDGKVISVNPIPGTEVDQGSTVTFALQRPADPQPTPQPDPTPAPTPDPEPDPEPEPDYIDSDDAMAAALDYWFLSEDEVDLQSIQLVTGGDAPHYEIVIEADGITRKCSVDAVEGYVWEDSVSIV